MKYCIHVFAAVSICLITLLLGCNAVENPDSRSPSNSYGLSDAEISKLTSAAEQGDIAAMKLLSLFYGINQQDPKKSIFWLERAAEAGDSDARDSVLGYYADSNSANEKEYGEALRRKWGQR